MDGDDMGGGEVADKFDWEDDVEESEETEEETEDTEADDSDDSDDEDDAPSRKRRQPATSDDDEDDGDDSDEDDEPKAKPKKPKKDDKPKSRKRKVKRGGQEVEVDLDDEETLLSLLGDLPRHRVKVDGEELEITHEDALKDYELRSASKKRMREASEQLKRHKSEIEKLRGDTPSLVEFLEETLEVDPRQVLLHYYDEDIRLQELLEQDPQRYGLEVSKREQKKAEQKLKRQREREEAERQKAEEDKRLQRFYAGLRDEVKSQGVPKNDVTLGLLQRMANQATDDVSPRDLVYEARRQLAESLGQLLPEDPDALAKMLGDKRLKALAKLRVEQDGKPDKKRKPAKKKRKSDEHELDELKRWELGG